MEHRAAVNDWLSRPELEKGSLWSHRSVIGVFKRNQWRKGRNNLHFPSSDSGSNKLTNSKKKKKKKKKMKGLNIVIGKLHLQVTARKPTNLFPFISPHVFCVSANYQSFCGKNHKKSSVQDK